MLRGFSSTPCLLSDFQAMKFCPRTTLWVDFGIQSPKCTDFCSFLFWILLVYICIPLRVGGPQNSKTISVKTDYGYCSSLHQTDLSASYMQLYYIPLMLYVWASWAGLVGTWSYLYAGQATDSLTQIFPRGQSLRYYPDPSKRLCLLYCLSFHFDSLRYTG